MSARGDELVEQMKGSMPRARQKMKEDETAPARLKAVRLLAEAIADIEARLDALEAGGN